MTAQDVILGARVQHVRELKTQVTELKSENDRLRRENEELRSHFDLALTAALDLGALPEGGSLVLVDGWNFILGANRTAKDPAQLRTHVEKYLAENPKDAAWIIFDGPHETTTDVPRLRVSYTGGTGAHRADRLVIAFVRMAAYLGLADRIAVRTCDKDFARTAQRLMKEVPRISGSMT